MTSISGGRRPASRFQIIGMLAVAAMSAALWFVWMGWDSQYQVDPVTKVASGPYEAWQVIGCALSLLVLFVGALLLGLRPLLASAALTLAFTAAWTVTAAPGDETGMYGVGMTMLFGGLAIATTLIALLVSGLRGLRSGRRPLAPGNQA